MHNLTRTTGICIALLAAAILIFAGNSGASVLVPQTALPGECIPKYAVPLPVFGPAGAIPRVDAVQHPLLQVTMKEINQSVLPQGAHDTCGLGVTFGKTRVWAYETRELSSNRLLGPANWPAVTVDAKRNIPTYVMFANQLPKFNSANKLGPPFTSGLVQGLVSVDQTIDWTDPLHTAATYDCNPFLPSGSPLPAACKKPYVGSPPAVVHLHGSEQSSYFDGGPLAWFTPDGRKGRNYYSVVNAGPGKAAYRYINKQEPGTLWFHDHAMGQTRTNVYSGLAAFYFLREPALEPKNLPSGAQEIEIALQDRQFDTNSQLFFPDGSGADAAVSNLNGTPPNPSIHPFWNPEFVGDVVIANGAPWPYLRVEPKRYRFRLLDGANARFWNLTFGSAPVYVIGSDNNYLDRPVKVTSLLMAPGERYDIIIDFTGLAGKTVTVGNNAPIPYPDGLSPVTDQPQMATVMRFKVSATASSADKSCNPAVTGGCVRPYKMVRLTDGHGHIKAGVTIDKRRQLILKEFEADPTDINPGGPLAVLVNNTQFMGMNSPNIARYFMSSDGVSELPEVGSTELWEIINLTADAHPIHTHLVQFQILNRESFAGDKDTGTGGYYDAWAAAFPAAKSYSPLCTGGVFCPGWGPPRRYNVPNADGALGGNPALGGLVANGGYLMGDVKGPGLAESGWKDTAVVLPGQVMRLLIRWTPSNVPVTANVSRAGSNLYSFDPTEGPGYVWHCHIIDHEDQDMMRPFKVVE
jgi:spore coat protein A, manganese oxidase